MKKIILGLGMIALLTSSGNNEKVFGENGDKTIECKKIAEKEIKDLDGYTLDYKEHTSRKGLKLAVPKEYESSTSVTIIRYKNANEDYKGCTCYYDSKRKLMGHKTY